VAVLVSAYAFIEGALVLANMTLSYGAFKPQGWQVRVTARGRSMLIYEAERRRYPVPSYGGVWPGNGSCQPLSQS
jgi:hypothetical protein